MVQFVISRKGKEFVDIITKVFQTTKQYNRNIKLVLLWNIVFCFGLGIYSVIFNLYLRDILGNSLAIGRITSLGFIIQGLVYIPCGLLSDRIGSRKTLLIGVIFLGSGYLFRAYTSSLVWLDIWTVISSVGVAMTIVCFVPILTEYSKREERVKLFSFAFGTGTFATSVGTLMGGVCTDFFHLILDFSETGSLQITMTLSAIMCSLCAIPLYFIKNNKALDNMKRENKQQIRSSATNKSLFTFGLSKFLGGVGLGLVIPYINLFLSESFQASNSIIGITLSLGTLGTVIAMSLNEKIVKKLGELKSVLVLQLFSIPFVILMGLSKSLLFACLLFIIFRSFKYSSNPIESAIMMSKVHSSQKGLANSIGWMASSFGMGIMSPVSMYFVSNFGTYWGYNISYLIAAVLYILSSILFNYIFSEGKQVREVSKSVTVSN